MRRDMSISELMNLRADKCLADSGVKDLWYDWFCKDTSLVRKGKSLLSRLSRLCKVNEKTNNKNFDPNKTYVFFKNNCPCNGSLYDDFRICDIETKEVIWTIIPSSGYLDNYGGAELWGKVNDFKEPVVMGKWEDIVEYFRH